MTLPPAQHGGNLLALARAAGLPPEALHDFSASINPLGPPAGVAAALQGSLAEAVHYPEQHAAPLVAALAEAHRLPEESLLAGNGSTELIYLLPRALRPARAAVVTPAFGEYARALELAGVPCDTLPLDPEDGFRFDPQGLPGRLDPDCALVLVANPGNPSGVPIPPAQLLQLADALAGRAILAVDEAFVDFCPDYSVLAAVAGRDNLVVLRSLTKFYAIPGLRCGFLAGPAQLVARLAAVQEPWSVGAPAQHAALACLADHGYRRATLRTIPRLRRQLQGGLERLGLTVTPSAANYLLGRLPKGVEAPALAARLQLQGILVRPCTDFAPLDAGWLRVAVRGAAENRLLLRALGALLAGG